MAPMTDKEANLTGSLVEGCVKINSKCYYLKEYDVSYSTTLNQFLREHCSLFGTKNSCNEGGCGVCSVVANIQNPLTQNVDSISINSCQTLVHSCIGWDIETIENLGNRYVGYHPLQKALVGFSGTQCGFCSPGFVMTMYGKRKTDQHLKAETIEKILDGNLCRCTGYRPILDAFKSLSVDGSEDLKNKLADIEDSYKSTCPKTGDACNGLCSPAETSENCLKHSNYDVKKNSLKCLSGILPKYQSTEWHKPSSLSDLYALLKGSPKDKNIRLLLGNTGSGVYKLKNEPDIYVDLSAISDLYTVAVGLPFVVGANVSLQKSLETFRQVAQNNPTYKYLSAVADHWEKVANVNVRNAGSWAGNLMLKHQYPEFPSDIFLTMVGVGAIITVGHPTSETTTDVSAEELLSLDMTRNVILYFQIPPFNENTYLRTYKISPRTVNAHAYINAAFRFEIDRKNEDKMLSTPTIVFGGIGPNFIHASKTEKYLENKQLFFQDTINTAVKILGDEIKAVSHPLLPSTLYLKSVAQSLFYKALLDIFEDKVSSVYKSGGKIIERPLSTGKQVFDANKDSWPVGKAIPKVESNIQVSGEAKYMDDVDIARDEVHGAFVQSKFGNAEIESIDPKKALELPGVISFVGPEDIPGENNFFQTSPNPDPIFASSKIDYAGQSLGLIIAKDRWTARRAVKMVDVKYKNIKKPILTIREALASSECHEETLKENDAEYLSSLESAEDKKSECHMPNAGPNLELEGEFEQGTQFHFTMEPLSARVVPMEDGFDVWCTTQWPDMIQSGIANALKIDGNSINLTVRRLGGGYGGKISRPALVACAAAVAAHKLRIPVRIVLDLEAHMTLVGWRDPYFTKYMVQFDKEGVMKIVRSRIYSDAGAVANEATVYSSRSRVPSVYYSPKWSVWPKVVTTNTAANTYCRTPGTVEAIASMENIIERIAFELKLDPLVVRERNFLDKTKYPNERFGPRDENLVRTRIFPLLKEKANYEQRRKDVESFNQNNRWKKRGLSMIPLYYDLSFPRSFRYATQVSIFASDGSVIITHGGIEMGQGINTKAVQVASKFLGVPLNFIKVKPTDLVSSGNSIVTGGSLGSDMVAHGIRRCCITLKQRMDIIKKEIEKKKKRTPTWTELVAACHNEDVDLTQRYWTAGNEHPKSYDIFGAACMEVEVDVLTGQYIILRTDIVEDCGRSLSPDIDVGQIEGAFVMGVGFYTSELGVFNEETGQKLATGTWNYKIPTASDIPVDFRITLLPKGDNDKGVLRSKATGEPALCLSYVVITALRDALKSARQDAGNTSWFEIDTPLTVEKVQRLCLVKTSDFVLSKEALQTEHDFCIIDSDDLQGYKSN